MVRYQVILAYDGTDFRGFQYQAKGRTVQGEVEKALRRLHWQGKRVLASGRTDTGVHGMGQVVVFDLDWQHSDLELLQALNAYLPEDIAARQIRIVNPRFDPRRSAQARCYQYRIFFQEQRDPLRERYAWRVWPEVDAEIMEQAAEMLTGEHDFRAFGTPPQAGGSTIRRIIRAGWQVEGDELRFEVIGNAFLYHMVRRMVSLQVIVGQGKMSLAEMSKFIDPEDAEIYIQGLAPAHGLCLVAVDYPADKLAIT